MACPMYTFFVTLLPPAVLLYVRIGGAPKYPQIKAIESGVQVVIATPGRLNDIMQMGKINMSNVMTLALDEADRMLDMGFEPQIRTIIDAMPSKRQTLFFTATWPKEVQRLARDFVQSPVHITVGDAGKLNANKSITQHIQVGVLLILTSLLHMLCCVAGAVIRLFVFWRWYQLEILLSFQRNHQMKLESRDTKI